MYTEYVNGPGALNLTSTLHAKDRERKLVVKLNGECARLEDRAEVLRLGITPTGTECTRRMLDVVINLETEHRNRSLVNLSDEPIAQAQRRRPRGRLESRSSAALPPSKDSGWARSTQAGLSRSFELHPLGDPLRKESTTRLSASPTSRTRSAIASRASPPHHILRPERAHSQTGHESSRLTRTAQGLRHPPLHSSTTRLLSIPNFAHIDGTRDVTMPSRPETTRDDLGISQRFSDELLEALAAARALPDAHVLGAPTITKKRS